MATKNIVPRANNEGELGTSSKKWNKVNATTITATSFVGDGSSITGVTAEWDGSHTGDATIAGNLSASINVSASGFYGEKVYATTLLDTPKINTQDIHNTGNGNREIYISNNTVGILNDFRAGMNASPDTLVVDMSEQKVGVNYDLSDLPSLGAALNVSGSTKFGELSSHSHHFTGSLGVNSGHTSKITLDVRQGINSSAYPVARFENTNSLGSTYIETHGVNQGGIKMYRGGVVRATIDTGGNAFCMYNGSPTPANLGFMITSGKAEFKETTADNFTGTKAQINISASSGPAVRVDSGNTPQETTFKIEDYTTTIVTGSIGLVTMGNTTVPPTPSSAAHIYAKSGEMFVMDTGGNETQISPHDEDGEWQYFSRNVKTGKIVRIRMEKMIRRLEEITGESFIEEI